MSTESRGTPYEVPVYRAEPVYATWYGYHVWDWGLDRTVAAHGEDLVPRWPSDDEIALGRGVGEGERERERRETLYQVRFRDPDDPTASYDYQPASAGELQAFAPGSSHRIRVWVSGTIEVVDG